jgi:hypothetical protein
MLVSSIAHMFHYKWSVPLTKTLSNQRLASRLVTEWLQTHSPKVYQPVLVVLLKTPTFTTDVF